MRLWIALRILLILLLAGPTFAAAQTQSILPPQWQSKHGGEHPLIGQIFSGSGMPSSQQNMLTKAADTKFVLLGESHDNPDHHIIQANILQALVDSNRRPSLVWEMVPQRLADQVNQFDLATDPQLTDYARRLEWEERGWYAWDIYRPIALAAAQNDLTMVAGNLDRRATRAISKTGIGALTPAQRSDFALTLPLASDIRDDLVEELRQSHCDLLPAKALPAMVNVQRARDGALADAMLRSGQNDGAVLIAGNGHIRNDRAVPLVLRHRLAGQTHSLAIALIEVVAHQQAFADYGLAESGGSPLYDFVIFTPQYDNTDHCAALREHFNKMKKTKP